MTLRNETRVVKVGNKYLGGNNPILVQSMCNTKTKDDKSTGRLPRQELMPMQRMAEISHL